MGYTHILSKIYPNMNDQTHQSIPLPGMIPNAAGGHYYEIDDWVKLDRFLILGTDGGTYYATAQDVTKQNVEAVKRCIDADGLRVVWCVVEISENGRAPKNDAAILALALCCAAKSDTTRKEALASISRVCRTGTHLLMFVDFVKRFRGFGRGLRSALGRWFTEKSSEALALQAIKYNQRNGWALRDVLRLAHPVCENEKKRSVLEWISHPERSYSWCAMPDVLHGWFRINHGDDGEGNKHKDKNVKYCYEHLIPTFKLPREAIPTELLNHKEIWSALLQDMPMTAMIRNLGKMTSVGLLGHLAEASNMICERLSDTEKLNRARIHPMQVLLAAKTYQQGHGDKGSLRWEPNSHIVGALNKAFDLTFPQVRSTGARLLVSVDCSGSMSQRCSGQSSLTAWQAGAAMALMLSRAERNAIFTRFDTDLKQFDIIDRRLDDVLNMSLPGGGTDVSLPVRYAFQNKIHLDAFVLFTDNQTWAGSMHAVQALHQYRKQINPNVKLIVAALSANDGSIIDPSDPLSFGICGLDASVPQLISDFIKGE